MIRLMTIEDYEQVYSLWCGTKGMGMRSLDDSAEGISRFLKRNPTTCFVAEEEGIQGVILCGHDGRRGFIYHMAVREEKRKKGIGSKLLEKALEALRKEGICKAALVVYTTNETGNAFWEKKGFTVREDLIYRNIVLDERNQ